MQGCASETPGFVTYFRLSSTEFHFLILDLKRRNLSLFWSHYFRAITEEDALFAIKLSGG